MLTPYARNAIALQMTWGCFGNQCHGRALKAKPLPLLFVHRNLQFRSITLSRRRLFTQAISKSVNVTFLPFSCSQHYFWISASFWSSLNLGVLSAGYIQFADNFYGGRRACIPLQAQSTNQVLPKALFHVHFPSCCTHCSGELRSVCSPFSTVTYSPVAAAGLNTEKYFSLNH